MDNILDKIKQKFLQDKLASEQRQEQSRDIMPDSAPVEPDARQQAYMDANAGLSEEQKMQLMTEQANEAMKRLAKKRAEAGYKEQYGDKDPTRESLYKQLMKR